mmetsp:Transcript_1405/g.2972  ORF Transcript_1405/g.2972 Transcript_1405/m.2972 type:complete len:153 (+) Transcript_1405:95-553(+)|eukprot:CAMPEP_0119503290 /NCGR_PEP_ID=MMETSP1344-20130328/24506_1 /TAXON_ID=236787 /ORGANISM="Florenciella parvula, Strain CCMP2471" /LENGTH=152 /DNA_ID=CAMNT_0007539569 /DNA_START=79 /DNA_END=537 /DNA_ORIENTATION=-
MEYLEHGRKSITGMMGLEEVASSGETPTDQIVATFDGPTLGIVIDDIDGRICVITVVKEAGEAAGVKLGYAVVAVNDTPLADLGVTEHDGLKAKLGEMPDRPIKLTLEAPPAAAPVVGEPAAVEAPAPAEEPAAPAEEPAAPAKAKSCCVIA